MRLFTFSGLILLGCSFMFGRSASGQSAPAVVRIDPTQQLQRFEGWGTSLCWWAKVAGGYPQADRERIADQVFDPVKGLGLNVVRYNIGGGENGHDTFLPFRAAVPSYEPAPGVWDWTADANQRWMLTAAIRRGVDHVEAFSNSPPYWMTVSGSVTGAADGGNNLRPDSYQAFADYLTSVVKHFRDDWHIQFDTLDPLNEPVGTWWTYGHNQEGCGFDRPAQARLLEATAASLAQKHLPTRLSAPDENQPQQTLASVTALPAADQRAVAQINTHSYGGSDRKALGDWAVARGKALWMSEYGDNDASGLTMSLQIVEDLKELRPATWVLWQVADTSAGWGLFRSREADEICDWTPNQKYAVFGNYTRFLRPGCIMLDVHDANTVAGFDEAQRRLSIVTTNASATERRLTFDLTAWRFSHPSVTADRTSDPERLTPTGPVSMAAGLLHATVPPRSVVTYVVADAPFSR